ncbi:MAG: flagellar motor protein, partial [Chromatiales bacterium]
MDVLSLLGLLLGAVAIIGGSILKGSGIAALVNGAAFLIVIVGTFAAILVQTPLATFLRALKILPWAFTPPSLDFSGTIEKLIGWSQIARREGLLGLETASED